LHLRYAESKTEALRRHVKSPTGLAFDTSRAN
jgi:hypothetical protein